MSWSAALRASLGATLNRPRWWLIALAGFLLRGGLLVFLAPIVILPTPAGLTNAVAPSLVGFVFGSPSDSFVALVVLAAVTAFAWLLGGGLLAAWLEVTLVAEMGAAPDLGIAPRRRDRLAPQALALRLVSHLPFAIAIGWGVARVVEAVYAELITPGDVAIPIVLRVVLRVPDVIVALVLTWLAGEAAGGLAVRRLVLGRDGPMTPWRALAAGWTTLARPASLGTLIVATGLLAAVAVPAVAAAGYAWDRVRVVLAGGVHPLVVAASLASFTSIWLSGLWLMAVVAAWRAAAWTYEAARRGALPPRDRHAGAVEPV